jgi:hypothetical protein
MDDADGADDEVHERFMRKGSRPHEDNVDVPGCHVRLHGDRLGKVDTGD